MTAESTNSGDGFAAMDKTRLKDYIKKSIQLLNIMEEKTVYKVDADTCISCGACESACPAGAIKMEQLAVITDACIDCGACESQCPVQAISA